MNTKTGEIIPFDELMKLSLWEQEDYIDINDDELTEKQRKNRKVSLKDNRSVLGKKRIKAVKGLKKKRKKKRRISKQSKQKNR